MKQIFSKVFVLLIVLLGLWSCKQNPSVGNDLKASQILIDTTLATSDSINAFIEPYRSHLNSVLDAPLCYATDHITKTEGKWNTPLGNLMADLMRERAGAVLQTRENIKVDLALHNFGGMRTAIAKGDVTERTAFEVMPFENKLVVAGISGKGIKKMVDFLIGSTRPHPISGMQIILDSKGAVKSLSIDGEPVEDERIYYVATSDYLVGGGDRMRFFQEKVSVYDTGYKIRNAMIDYFKAADTLRPQIDNRFIQLDSL
ncbi:5'-nucleotidase C-terminal domain-containing protein [Robiginitalea aurantiaca]|uniref:5'-nucleotidase C-terminal domain-containing protein n=1 Tax=Robiginitalea aurantiaca TaxID=3056915 RepID=A0ABT7WGA5_9FLAO|nr:5'-nucleotidase C-terminal domain-containing protein [Robiginitalea aurantiaca]MDM9631953.1 5'-nucleotidase C-terminal domain-containing protein [Robiginitalea aurantiaca]